MDYYNQVLLFKHLWHGIATERLIKFDKGYTMVIWKCSHLGKNLLFWHHKQDKFLCGPRTQNGILLSQLRRETSIICQVLKMMVHYNVQLAATSMLVVSKI